MDVDIEKLVKEHYGVEGVDLSSPAALEALKQTVAKEKEAKEAA